MNRIKVFCFPYAGGSASIYSRWRPYLDTQIELRPIELAGRGKRIQDNLYQDMNHVVEDIFSIVQHEVITGPYVLFGHSMGSMIAYHLATKIRTLGLPEPQHLFFSGSSAPQIKRPEEKKYSRMGDEEFRKNVLELGGTPPEFLITRSFCVSFLPLLKNDFRIAEEDFSDRPVIPFSQNITIFQGKDDDLTAEQRDGWTRHSQKRVTFHYFEGGHFFLNDHTEQIVTTINETLVRQKSHRMAGMQQFSF